ncbi:MAG: slipin family protein [Planctomycetaceae bacterium]|jgi:regulator of protease activity HflC (stomatin/prohibitin superfamily)|nr:slipin family protein [Planctomycetaceae bacterium]
MSKSKEENKSFFGGTTSYDSSGYSHASLGTQIRGFAFVVPMLVIGAALLIFTISDIRTAIQTHGFPKQIFIWGGTFVVFGVLWYIFVSGIRVASQWERGVVLRLGKYHRIGGPGIVYIVPFFENIRFVELRLMTLNIPSQQVITRDNVPASVDSVLFFLVTDPKKAVLEIQNYQFAVTQYSQATLRDVIGGLSLDELLSERDQIQNRIVEVVEERIKNWGLHIDMIRLQDIEMPEDLKRIMSRQATAEREKRATITKAEGDRIAAENLSAAARVMQQSPGAMKLRTLQTIDSLGAGPSNTVILMPAELGDTVSQLVSKFVGKSEKEPTGDDLP